MPNQQLTQIIDRLIAKADRDARGEGIEVQFEDRLGDIQKARDAQFAEACFPAAFLPGFVAGCWHYRSLSQRGSIWAIHPPGEWKHFEDSQDVFDRAYRFTQVLAEYFRRMWLKTPSTNHPPCASVTLRRATPRKKPQAKIGPDFLNIVYPKLLVKRLLPEEVRLKDYKRWSKGEKNAMRNILSRARLDLYLWLCHSGQKNNELALFLNDCSRCGLFLGPRKSTFLPADPMKDGVYAQLVEPLFQLLQSGIFWLDDLAKNRESLVGHLLLYPPGTTSCGQRRYAFPWCSVNVACKEGKGVEQRFIELHQRAFGMIFDHVYGNVATPDLEQFAPGSARTVFRLAERLARQEHEGQALAFHVVVGLKSVIDNGLRCEQRDRLEYYTGQDKPKGKEELAYCPKRLTPDAPEPCRDEDNGHCKDHRSGILRVAHTVIGNYSFFQLRDAVLWAQAEDGRLILHRASVDRGFLFPGQLRTRHEVVQELCMRNPAAIVYECSSEGVHRVRCLCEQRGMDVVREIWTGSGFEADAEWKPWEAVRKAYERFCEAKGRRKGSPAWREVLYRVVEKLVDTRKGGTFVLAGSLGEAERFTYPMTRVYFIERKRLSGISDGGKAEDDLYHLAIEDGAVVLCVDAGTLILGRRFLTPRVARNARERYGDRRDTRSLQDGARHTSARLLSAKGVPVLCVSADGPISLYFRGKRDELEKDRHK